MKIATRAMPVVLILFLFVIFPVYDLQSAELSESFCELPKGAIVLVGGSFSAKNHAIFEKIKILLGQNFPGAKSFKMAVIGSAKKDMASIEDVYFNNDPEEPEEYPAYKTRIEREGFESSLVPIALDLISTNYNPADDSQVVQAFSDCHVFFFLGGDQAKIAKCFLREDGSDTLFLKMIRNVYRNGGVVMGTSAGTHIMSNPMFGWGESYETLFYNRLEKYSLKDIPSQSEEYGINALKENNSLILPAPGFLPAGILTDSHFDARGRLGRLVVGMRDTGCKIGLGIDEGTAIIISKGVGSVTGENGVFVINSTDSEFSSQAGSGEKNGFSAQKILVSRLSDGDSYDLAIRKTISGKPVYYSADNNMATDMILSGKATCADLQKSFPSDNECFSTDVFNAITFDGSASMSETSSSERKNKYQATAALKNLMLSGKNSVVSRTSFRYPAFFVSFSRLPESNFYQDEKGNFCVDSARLDISIDLNNQIPKFFFAK
ncbi:MAG: cyanophycinase [Candidatus Riflebacteria bacterium]|nr:cyanophycinase [Candidatus Riflebacteria bacterium]